MTLPTPELIQGRMRLVLLAALVLFVELALIRWVGSNIVYLSYFSNFILLGSFLGIGVGFLRGRARHNLFPYSPVALTMLVGFVLIFPVQIDRSGDQLIYFGTHTTSGLPPWVTLPLIFAAVAVTLMLLAEGLAREFVRYEPLEAYRLDIIGSITGIASFSVASFIGAPPVVWGLVAAILFLILIPPFLRLVQAVAIVGLVLILGRESLVPGYSWSPYYRVEIAESPDAPGVIGVGVNGIPHQIIKPTGDLAAVEPLYLRPYDRITADSPGRVLIIGAGTGTDVALALSRGATSVDAVEIDPRLAQLGQERHPDRPYQDPRVTLHVTDGRAFLEQTDATYDLILFALPDSLTVVGGQSSVRLESYLFTVEAIEAARERLAEDGTFAMYNYYREDWLVDRLAGTLEAAFGQAPCVDAVREVGWQATITVGNSPGAVDCEQPWTATGAVPEPARDDYPFLYLRERSIPDFYLITMALIVVAAAAMVRTAGARFGAMSSYVDLFFMGAAFLLLETKSVVQFALLFGTTWFVNSLVFAGVLLSVYLAIELTQRVRLPRADILYGVLLASVLVAMLVPLPALLELPSWLRFVAATGLWFTPIFIANLVFAQRFRTVEASHVAFGANLLGAVAGGVLEYVALLTGYTVMAVVVALLYGLAFAFGRSHLRTTAPATTPVAAPAD